MLKIRQSYNGRGKGYRFEVYNNEDKYLGVIKNFPYTCAQHDIININGVTYKLIETFDSALPEEFESEVIYHILEPYSVVPDYDLGDIVNLTEYFSDLVVDTINSVGKDFVELIDFNKDMNEVYVLTKEGGLTITIKEEIPKEIFDKFNRILEAGENDREMF